MDEKPNLQATPDWDADVVLTFPSNAKETTVLWFKNNSSGIYFCNSENYLERPSYLLFDL